MNLQRSLIHRAISPRIAGLITDANVTNLIIPAQPYPTTLLEGLGEIETGVLRLPEQTGTEIRNTCGALNTSDVYIDLTSSGSPTRGPLKDLEGFDSITVLATYDIYERYIDCGFLNFEHRFAMLIQDSLKMDTNIRRAHKYFAIPVFVMMNREVRENFSEFEEHVSEFTGSVIFWSYSLLESLAQKHAVTISDEPRLVAALSWAPYRAEPDMRAQTLGNVRPAVVYPLLEEVGDFVKIVVDGSERFAPKHYFVNPRTL